MSITETIRAEVEAAREDLVALSSELVAAHSVNPEGDTRAVAEIVTRTLREHGLEPTTITVNDIMPNVIAVIDSGRPGPHLLLNVHQDTMPAGDESAWSVDPWQLTRKDGRLYGLGMGNMKGAVAAMTFAAGALHRHRDQWAGKVTFTAVSDEVVFGPNGAAHLVEQPEFQGDAMLCGEGPGFRRIGIGEKGVLWLAIEATGEAGHSSSVTLGRSASARIAAATLAIDALNGLRPTPPAELAALFDTEQDSGFSLSANVGTLQAGSFVGQVATTARAEVDLRIPPGLTCDEVEAMVADAVADIETVTVSRIKGWDPNWTGIDSPIVASFVASNAELGYSDTAPAVRLPASDASRWRTRGIPALCYGPQPTLSAGIDDYAEEDEVLRCAALYTLTALKFLAP